MIVIDGKSAVSHIDTLKLQIISVTNCRFSQAIAEKHSLTDFFQFRSDLSDAAKTFLHDLLEIEPSQRSTLEAARNSTWIQTHA